jgi:hypothetical protein
MEGIQPNLPNSTARTRPLDPLPTDEDEKRESPNSQWDDPEPLKTPWWHKLMCWKS